MAFIQEYNIDIWVPFTNQDHRVEFIQADGCWSLLGKVTSKDNKQSISIADGCQAKNIVLHELMHAMGFHHEQNRVDRDKYIKIITENIQDGLEGQFKKANQNNIFETNSGYDYMSIMQYELTAFSKNGRPTMELKNTEQALSLTKDQLQMLGNVPDLSVKDIKELRMYFNCESSEPPPPPTTKAPTTESPTAKVPITEDPTTEATTTDPTTEDPTTEDPTTEATTTGDPTTEYPTTEDPKSTTLAPTYFGDDESDSGSGFYDDEDEDAD